MTREEELEKLAIERCMWEHEHRGHNPMAEGCGNKKACICYSCKAITMEEAERRYQKSLPNRKCDVCHKIKKAPIHTKQLSMCRACIDMCRTKDVRAYCFQKRGCVCIDRMLRKEHLVTGEFGDIYRCGYTLGQCTNQVRTRAEAIKLYAEAETRAHMSD